MLLSDIPPEFFMIQVHYTEFQVLTVIHSIPERGLSLLSDWSEMHHLFSGTSRNLAENDSVDSATTNMPKLPSRNYPP